MTTTPLQFACSGKDPVLRAFPLSVGIALGKKLAVNVFYAARLQRPLSNDVPEHYGVCGVQILVWFGRFLFPRSQKVIILQKTAS